MYNCLPWVLVYSGGEHGNIVWLRLQSYNVYLLAMVLVYLVGAVNTVRLRLQSYSVKLLAMGLVYSGEGFGTQSG